jgi:hypothetical protein
MAVTAQPMDLTLHFGDNNVWVSPAPHSLVYTSFNANLFFGRPQPRPTLVRVADGAYYCWGQHVWY